MMEGIKMDVKILEKNKVDVKHGLELLGDMDFYNETIETFYKNIDKNIKDLKKTKILKTMVFYLTQ